MDIELTGNFLMKKLFSFSHLEEGKYQEIVREIFSLLTRGELWKKGKYALRKGMKDFSLFLISIPKELRSLAIIIFSDKFSDAFNIPAHLLIPILNQVQTRMKIGIIFSPSLMTPDSLKEWEKIIEQKYSQKVVLVNSVKKDLLAGKIIRFKNHEFRANLHDDLWTTINFLTNNLIKDAY